MNHRMLPIGVLALLAVVEAQSADSLYHAIRSNDVEVVSEYLVAGGDPDAKIVNLAGDPNIRVAPLELAIAARRDSISASFVKAGASLAASASMGDLLEAAAQQGLAETVSAILRRQPDVLRGDQPLNRSLPIASAYGRHDVVQLLLIHGDKQNVQWRGRLLDAFFGAALSGSEDIARMILAAGLDVSQAGVLHVSVHRCNSGLVRDLIRAGAPIGERFEGNTPLDLAIARLDRRIPGDTAGRIVVEELIDEGADVCAVVEASKGLSTSALAILKMNAPDCDWPET